MLKLSKLEEEREAGSGVSTGAMHGLTSCSLTFFFSSHHNGTHRQGRMPKAKAQRPSARSATGKGKVSAAGASGSLASVCSNGGPAPAPAAQRATTRPAPPGRTQLAIRRLLAFDLGQVDFGRMVSVITDRHMRPPNLSAEQLALEPAKTCCFDAAGGASPSWTAHELCDSCTLYNQFIQGESRCSDQHAVSS